MTGVTNHFPIGSEASIGREEMPTVFNLVKSLWLGRSQALGELTTDVSLNRHAVKLVSKY